MGDLEYKKDDIVWSVRGRDIDETLEKLKQILQEKAKTIPDGIDHSLWLSGITLQWDYYNVSSPSQAV